MTYNFDKENHLHTLDGKPLTGTSTVMKVISKPLTWWASGLAVSTLGWTKAGDWKTLKTAEAKEADINRRLEKAKPAHEMIKEMEPREYLALLDKAYKAHAEKLETSAEAGTDLHAELEKFVKDRMNGITGVYPEKIKPFIDWTDNQVEKFLWSEIHTFSEGMWTGGISDCGALLKDGSVAIIDFKSSKEAYFTHFAQIGGYDLQITENGGYTKDGEKIFTLLKPITKHIVVPFGAKEPYVVAVENVEDNREAFKSALSLYRLMSKLNAI
jgi:hypothetical protein